jgi:acyl carrier protein
MDTKSTIREALGKFALAPVPEDESASLFELGVIDSFGLMDLIADLEGRLGVKVPDADLVPRKFETIAKMNAYFESRVKD